MSFQRSTLAGLVILAATLACDLPVQAKDGRDFAGLYSVSATEEPGGRESVTMRLQLFNYSGADIQNAVVLLRPNHPGGPSVAKTEPIPEWRNRSHAVIEQQFTMPKSEYAQWLAGAQPNLVIIYMDSAGEEKQRTAQVRISPPGSF